MKGEGLRYNEGKVMLDLVPESAIRGMAEVLTFGARKYAPHNWRKGMKWSNITSSLKRHLAAIDRGEDYDPESGLMHIDHVLTNAAFLKEYYKIFPEGDDRWKKPKKRIALDVDEVLADFTKAWAELYKDVPSRPTAWNYDRKMKERFKQMEENGTISRFYGNLECKVDPDTMPFEPVCYVTSRPIDSSVTAVWLDIHRFPAAKVLTVPLGESKVEALKSMNVDIFIDDSYDNFVECNNNGIFTYLYDAPHNQRYNVGHMRIKKLEEING